MYIAEPSIHTKSIRSQVFMQMNDYTIILLCGIAVKKPLGWNIYDITDDMFVGSFI